MFCHKKGSIPWNSGQNTLPSWLPLEIGMYPGLEWILECSLELLHSPCWTGHPKISQGSDCCQNCWHLNWHATHRSLYETHSHKCMYNPKGPHLESSPSIPTIYHDFRSNLGKIGNTLQSWCLILTWGPPSLLLPFLRHPCLPSLGTICPDQTSCIWLRIGCFLQSPP
jgi:hypothetical protein